MPALQTLTASKFFKNKEGDSLKFRLQPGLSLKTQLEDVIISHGGTILTKIPIHGVVVIDPKSNAGRELLLEWAWPERPFRFFVSYTYVLACSDAGRLLPLRDSALKREISRFGVFRGISNQAAVSDEVKEQLTAYLASILPDPMSGNRSSNTNYVKLMEDTNKYPWASGLDWKVLRNEYCRNKDTYDWNIARLAEMRSPNLSSIPLSSPTLEVNLRAPKASANRLTPSGSGKKSLIEQPRKFAFDITNLKRKGDSAASIVFVPRRRNFLAENLTGREDIRKKARLDIQTPDYADVEFGRATVSKERGHVSESFRGRKTSLVFTNTPTKDLLSSFKFDSGAFGPVRMLAEAEGEVDEKSVEDILGLSTVLEDSPLQESEITELDVDTSEGSSMGSFARELADSTRFTVREIEQKYAGFSGDMHRTRAFFMRCRSLVDDLYSAQMNETITSTSGRMMLRSL